MSDIPPEFNDILGQLNQLAERGSSISGRVSQLKENLRRALEGLKEISLKSASITEMVNRLKQHLVDLEGMNDELKQTLANTEYNFSQEMEGLRAKQASELDEARANLERERQELEARMLEQSNMSQADKERALQELQQSSASQQEAIRMAHEEERAKLVGEYQRVYASLIQALTSIAQRQAEAINQIDAELTDSEGLTTEFASVQQQITSLLASISDLLNDANAQRASVSQGQFQRAAAPVLQEQPVASPEIVAPNINLNEIESESSPDNIPETADTPPQNNVDLFEYMLRVLAMRLKSGQMNERQIQSYNENIKPEFNYWSQLSKETPQNIASLTSQKKKVYYLVNYLFNATKDVAPKSPSDNINLVGGRKTRRHKRVHFKTRAKRGGKSSKKGGKRGGKSRKGGKRSGGKRSKKV